MHLRMRKQKSALNKEDQQLADLYIIHSVMVEWSSILCTIVSRLFHQMHGCADNFLHLFTAPIGVQTSYSVGSL